MNQSSKTAVQTVDNILYIPVFLWIFSTLAKKSACSLNVVVKCVIIVKS